MNLGKAIRTLRKDKELSQEQLAKDAHITQAALSQIERGKRPGNETIKKIAAALGVPESLIYALALEREEVPEQNRVLYDQIFPIIKNMITQLAVSKTAS